MHSVLQLGSTGRQAWQAHAQPPTHNKEQLSTIMSRLQACYGTHAHAVKARMLQEGGMQHACHKGGKCCCCEEKVVVSGGVASCLSSVFCPPEPNKPGKVECPTRQRERRRGW